MIVVAKKVYISVLQLFISRMPKMCAILQLVSAPLNPIPAGLKHRSQVTGQVTGQVRSLGRIFFCQGS